MAGRTLNWTTPRSATGKRPAAYLHKPLRPAGYPLFSDAPAHSFQAPQCSAFGPGALAPSRPSLVVPDLSETHDTTATADPPAHADVSRVPYRSHQHCKPPHDNAPRARTVRDRRLDQASENTPRSSHQEQNRQFRPCFGHALPILRRRYPTFITTRPHHSTRCSDQRPPTNLA